MIVVEAVNDASPATLISSPAAAPSPLSEMEPVTAVTVNEPDASISLSVTELASARTMVVPEALTSPPKSFVSSLSVIDAEATNVAVPVTFTSPSAAVSAPSSMEPAVAVTFSAPVASISPSVIWFASTSVTSEPATLTAPPKSFAALSSVTDWPVAVTVVEPEAMMRLD